uniref:Uncharacterized protein n=1 Tax=Hemiselmis tepida TaxID=464990 RepID=A0A7S0VY05_9CRYP
MGSAGPAGKADADVFDSVTGYTDMTGVAKFDDAWEAAYRRKDGIRCPFWRRRTVDALEMILNVARFVVSRHKTLDVTPVRPTGVKSEGMTLAQVADVLRADFEERQYYVTGRLSKRVYADDCFFDAPDPDMPVTGLRKYVDAISHLFEARKSRVDLLDMQLLPERGAVLARWRLEGTLMLPWRPAVRAYTGVTLYELNERGLVGRHTEIWSQHVLVAFLSVILPVDHPYAQRALGLIGVPVDAPAPPAEAILKLPAADRAPDPAPLLSKGGRGPLAGLRGVLAQLWRGSSTV